MSIYLIHFGIFSCFLTRVCCHSLLPLLLSVVFVCFAHIHHNTRIPGIGSVFASVLLFFSSFSSSPTDMHSKIHYAILQGPPFR